MASLHEYGGADNRPRKPNYKLFYDDGLSLWTLVGRSENTNFVYTADSQEEAINKWIAYLSDQGNDSFDPEY